MKICILRMGKVKARVGFEIAFFGEFRGVRVYLLAFDKNLRKRRFEKVFRKASFILSKNGVTLSGAPSSLGIAGAVSERELLLDLRARFAEVLSGNLGMDVDFQLCGGSMRRRVAAAVFLLERRRKVYLSCADFEETAERISALTGASVSETPPGNFIAVNLSETDEIMSFGDMKISLSDFRLTLPWEKASELSAEEILTLAAMLEICGVLRKKEIKVECFVK